MTAGAELAERNDEAAGAAAVVELDGACSLSRDRIGGKAWSVNRMRALGLSVPPAFVITIDGWADFAARGVISEDIWRSVRAGITALERGTGRTFGSGARPLLVSVRSGAAVSMPGMMDTVLNLGMNEVVAGALAAETGNSDYAVDTRERFRTQYRETVLGDPAGAVPEDPWEQLRAAISAVFRSWDSPRAQTYRRNRGVPGTLGTAVTVQAMVFGNLDEKSGTGVLFSRNPNTGERAMFGEWLVGGQGEDVVSGRTTPRPLEELAASLPQVHRELVAAADLLERDGRDIQDIEFTVESGALWLLQSRPAKRSARAAVRAAVAMAEENLIGTDEALSRVTAEQVRAVLRPATGEYTGTPLARGESACPGLATGIVVSDPHEAERRAEAGEDVILVRPTTSPDDLHGMIAARGIVTGLGGVTSHAALVSREIGRPCVVGCGPGVVAALVGTLVTVDGGAGTVWPGRVEGRAVDASTLADASRLAGWAGTDVDGLAGWLDARAADGPARTEAEPSATVTEIPDLDLLRLIGIKGRAAHDALAAGVGGAVEPVAARCEELVVRGLCAATPIGVRLTPEGRQHLDGLLATERRAVDRARIASVYAEFCAFNGDLKAIVTAWQMKDPATVNDHADTDYDGAVLARLSELHRAVQPLLRRIGDVAPRLTRYSARFAQAIERIAAGEHAWVARPVLDSYHTVWFELHEDLIGLCGLSRADEAAAGRAH
ncbi:pyruvate, phosphate dikinase [Nocardia abscessus]|uniref:pyruvate, phosphate dikinase n=1 Tax=Nocardia abscessus TaxID=120957 RepID=UPI001894EC58|nr:pyruvate, phosphate dikinase [Nocardia abscessus]MBF6336724.1 pyruvate, phosphate dikinase [Nocardia abscessus]